MQILLNQYNEIVAYAVVGGIEREGYETVTIEDNQVPNSFQELFKPSFYIFENGEIKVNSNYHEENEEIELPQVPFEFPTSDEALRRMFSSMQVQIVQGNKMVTQLTQQNANLSQQIVLLQQEIENLKGGDLDETTIS
ncbi:DUF2977 domain-containing protein [Staphylococcus arlettae]|uniref:DUF2977 domain-containing protein n=1 Tax=Staphylococcus arlettae TaxID=29378 RepID=UPI000D1B8D87|nr:DUF2977 domain-containing protein [Staphylococcus arlettae]PTH60492.1 hypothetical protein BU599_05180 [Staphylococcus arlettae]RIM69936.1 DUF2977 domain-containing protein [Staphylococcus arlettae]RIM74633.1 DUF2977 domain-containing protein [Staphylococcus arlettae]